MADVIIFPVPSIKSVTHSRKIEWALRSFIVSMGGSYYDDEIEKGIITSYFRLDHGICVEQRIQIGETDCVCYTTLSCNVPANGLAKYIAIVNRLNTQIRYGNFEIVEKTGDIRFRTYYEVYDRISIQAIDKLLGYPKCVINQYGHMFLGDIARRKEDVQNGGKIRNDT